jgi:O-antigen ligase
MPNGSIPSIGKSWAPNINRERIAWVADSIAIALAVSLPWSTSATGILVVLWIIAFVPALDKKSLQRVLLTPAGGIPVLLWALGVVGMLWADVPLAERWNGVESFLKLLVIPLLMIQFQRSERARWVVVGFLLSCGALLVISWAMFLFPDFPRPAQKAIGVPVKDYISQSAMFIICIAVLIELAFNAWQKARFDIAVAYVVFAIAFLANIIFIATSRTAFVVLPILLLLFGYKRVGLKGVVGLLAVSVVLTAAAWPFSASMQNRVTSFLQEVHDYRIECKLTSAGERLAFWKVSLEIIGKAPVIGHGTGTIRDEFSRSATAEDCESTARSANPHNQMLAVAIQLGLVGAIALCAMWIAHLLLFRGEGLTAWVGMAVVVQNIVGSLFNSHLFDFTHGWGYVIGVGIAGGVMLRNGSRSISS